MITACSGILAGSRELEYRPDRTVNWRGVFISSNSHILPFGDDFAISSSPLFRNPFSNCLRRKDLSLIPFLFSQCEEEGRAFVDGCLGPDSSSVTQDDSLHD